MNPRFFSVPNHPGVVAKRRMTESKFSSLFAPRAHIVEGLDAGLTSVSGAREIISAILSRRIVTKLLLGHNQLGDDGCELLFDFLFSDQGRKYKVSEISLNSNQIGDRGLRAIVKYLEGNTTLRELFLQNNSFTYDAELVSALTGALNSSRLETLSLTSNTNLSDSFIAQFFSVLESPYIRDLQLSVLHLTPRSAPHIIKYITSPRCRLHTLQLNGNRLGLRAARTIVHAIYQRNFTIVKAEMYANMVGNTTDGSADEEDLGKNPALFWKESERLLQKALQRNGHLNRQTKREALALLVQARAVLLRPERSLETESLRSSLFVKRFISSIGTTADVLEGPQARPFPFDLLPAELQLYILSFIAPTLSPSQRIRICNYASSPSTLPPLLPSLTVRPFPSHSSVHAPELFAIGAGMRLHRRNTASTSFAPASDSDVVMGHPLVSHRDEERAKWLSEMQCDTFEADIGVSWNEEEGLEGLLAPRAPQAP